MTGPRDEEFLRAFIALAIQDEVRASLARYQGRLKRTGAKVSWVRAENIHLTLLFLGDIAAGRVEKLGRAMDGVAGQAAPFAFEVAGLGAFGSPRRPRVIWAGVQEPSGALPALYTALAAAVRELGFEVEARAFKPHLTLGRVRGGRGVAELTSALASAKNTTHGRVAVDRLYLMQSRLEPEGAQYSVLHASLLGGAQTNGNESI